MLKNLFKQIILESIEKYDGFEFYEDYFDHHHGQDVIRCDMYKDDIKVAKADYVKYNGKIFISFIESIVKGHGYGVILMKHLAKLYGYRNLERSSLTDDGVKMRQKLDKHYNYSYEKEIERRNKLIKPSLIEKIKDQNVKDFIKDILTLGYEKTWEIWLEKPGFRALSDELEKRYDLNFNDVEEIAMWIKTGDKYKTEIPLYVKQDLVKLLRK